MGKQSKRMEVFELPTRYYPSDTLSLHELSYWIAFSRVSGIGPARFKLLLDFFHDDVELAWRASMKDLAQAGLDSKTIESFLQQRTTINPAHELERMERLRIQVITWKDDSYPPLLRKIDYAPPVLYLCGQLADDDREFTMGIVGTRKMSSYGRQVTEHFTRELVQGRVTIVSGLALGVDTVAHTTALDTGGRTIAVLACGLDTIYPSENYRLAKRIVESGQGVLLTAYPLGVRPEAGNFPARNHIISGLSQGIIVTEAPQKSGSLITANSALTQGREVFAVPGNIFSPGSSGPNKLIRDGAHAISDINDILSNLNYFMLPQQPSQSTLASEIVPDNEEQKILLQNLGREPLHVDELIRVSALPADVVIATLTFMELTGMVNQVGSMQYIRGTMSPR
ncbi:MAG TPA: DNA-processing protein DprA [Dictyobacter sp.]|jgi:DNA processing protein|nr:DNA-processing protein DprA [Dictyobacter sp.]